MAFLDMRGLKATLLNLPARVAAEPNEEKEEEEAAADVEGGEDDWYTSTFVKKGETAYRANKFAAALSPRCTESGRSPPSTSTPSFPFTFRPLMSSWRRLCAADNFARNGQIARLARSSGVKALLSADTATTATAAAADEDEDDDDEEEKDDDEEEEEEELREEEDRDEIPGKAAIGAKKADAGTFTWRLGLS